MACSWSAERVVVRVALYLPSIRRFSECRRAKRKESVAFIMTVMVYARFLMTHGVPSAAVNFVQSWSSAGIHEKKRYCCYSISKR